jgi:hypothetical protein
MTQIVSPTPSTLPTDTEIHAMAGVLMRRYGSRAGEVAQHFKLEHEAIGDETRAALWNDVCDQLEQTVSSPTLS